MKTIADKIISFNKTLDFKGSLPAGIRIMNPFREDKNVMEISSEFYRKYYNDFNKRYLILGINPGRFGGGLTGIPFTDPKRLTANCGIAYSGSLAHEPSSAYVYDVIDAFGGPVKFYSRFYINSICPLGFTSMGSKGREVNYNYYDSMELTDAVYEFMVDNIRKQISMGVHTDVCFCFGTGKNEKFLRKLNDRFSFFGRIVALEHPRFVMQYKSRFKGEYIRKYVNAFNEVG